MKCEKCNNNIATIHFIKLVNGEKTEILLCENCAKEITDNQMLDAFDDIKNISFSNILGNFFEVLNKNKEPKIEVVCKNCGLTYSQFKNSGQLGCSECYESFNDALKPLIKRLQGDLDHIGKIPKATGDEFLTKKKINKLKKELQEYIVTEEYEKAAKIRDEIKILESNGGKDDRNEKLDI